MSPAKAEVESFEDNFLKLERLSEELQENTVSIDELVPRMKEALGAIKVCKKVLANTKSQLKEVEKEFSEVTEDSDAESESA